MQFKKIQFVWNVPFDRKLLIQNSEFGNFVSRSVGANFISCAIDGGA
jgi:hypothetical protein